MNDNPTDPKTDVQNLPRLKEDDFTHPVKVDVPMKMLFRMMVQFVSESFAKSLPYRTSVGPSQTEV